MDLRQVDLNLLVVFEAVFRTGSVTEAAHEVKLSQPAVSSALGRLRDLTGDTLFVRTAKGMQPTPRAEQIIGPIRDSLSAIHQSLNRIEKFDHTEARHTFRLILTDIGETVYLPPLVERTSAIAPNIKIEVIPADKKKDGELLRSGVADLAVGTFAYLRYGFEQELLFYGKFVCALRRQHPKIGNELRLEDYIRAKHAIVAQEDRTDGVVESSLSELGVSRNIHLRLQHYVAAATVLSRTDLIMTIPERLAELFAQAGDTRFLPLPFAMPPIQIRQYWHRHQNHSGANRWLRGVMADLFRLAVPEQGAPEKGRRARTPPAEVSP